MVQFALSKDGIRYGSTKIAENKKIVLNPNREIQDFSVIFENIETHYIRVKAKNIGNCPKWHKGSGGKAWLFVDEIIVE